MGIKSQRQNYLSPRVAIPHFMLLLQTINGFTILHVFCIYEVTVNGGGIVRVELLAIKKNI